MVRTHLKIFVCGLAALILQGCVSQPETILVGGATGRQGGAVVDELLSRGYAVRGMTRQPDGKKAQALAAKNVEVVKADYGDRKSLEAAMQDVERMFFYSGFSRDEVGEGENVIAAAKASGIRHIVYSSGAAADPANGPPDAAKLKVELALIDSGIPYTVLRPVAFMENFRGQQKRIASAGIVESRGPERMLHFISIPDIGFLAGEAFDHPDQWVGEAINIASDAMTVEEYVATFSRVMGRDIKYTRLPLEEYLATMPKPLRPLFRWYDQVGYSADVDGLRARYPNLSTLEGWLRANGFAGGQTGD